VVEPETIRLAIKEEAYSIIVDIIKKNYTPIRNTLEQPVQETNSTIETKVHISQDPNLRLGKIFDFVEYALKRRLIAHPLDPDTSFNSANEPSTPERSKTRLKKKMPKTTTEDPYENFEQNTKL
jgi:hypothetical protein